MHVQERWRVLDGLIYSKIHRLLRQPWIPQDSIPFFEHSSPTEVA